MTPEFRAEDSATHWWRRWAIVLAGALALVVAVGALVPPSDTGDNEPAATGPSATAVDLLNGLTVVEAYDVPVPYDRSEYDGDGWTDVDGDCLNTRHEVLAAESTTEPVIEDCRVVAGTWTDWLTGDDLTSPEEATIDHVVALAHAHRAGGWRWSPETKQSFANDLDEPAVLNVASAGANQSKADQSPDQWRPDDERYWCVYAWSWIRVKSRWGLAVTADEVDALVDMLATCDAGGPEDRAVAIGPAAGTVLTDPVATAPVGIAPPTPTRVPVAPTPDPSSPDIAQIVGCDARREIVTIANPGTAEISLSGWWLHDEGVNHSYTFGAVTLEPGETIRVLAGEDTDAFDTAAAASDLRWTSQNVWNNDGDTAHLVDLSGAVIATRRC